MWDDDNDDELLRRALEESRIHYEEVELPRLSQRVNASSPITISDDSLPGPSTSAQETSEDSFKRPLPPPSLHSEEGQDALYDGSEAEGFSFKAGQSWIYPTSDKYPIRTYQRSIVETALFHNTLVSLPTGLGKTFIAAVVMYNFYMWYPKGKIIFMAPTKPLVAQQIENCVNIMGIPESHTAEMTGATHSKLRAGTWKEKRVFFLTPQVVQNDLTANICPANAVKCIVIDEAHRALGDHAYAQVIRILNSYEAHFRVLALSATPGSDLEAVQKVVSNLMISRIELRSEDSPDIVQYTHERNLELMVVDVGPTINRIRVKFVGIAADYARNLQQQKLLFGSISSIPRFTVLREWENFRRERSGTMDPAVQNRMNSDFAIVLTLVHGLELLQTYGLRLLLNHLKAAVQKGDQAANRLSVNEELRSLMEEIEGVLNPIEIDADEGEEKKKRCIYGHPKLDRLQEVIVSHFENFQKKGEPTRSIVFCEYREGVIEICDMLKNFEPLVKPVVFMGQSAGKGGKGISQKQQLEIMEKFRSGSYNTLISTSVGEEGLDIGEVDLIICFDAKNSPIRQVQRMGRTGRKRQGRIIMLVTKGKEEQKYNLGLFKKKSVKAVLLNKENLANHLLEESPRMLPPGVQPQYCERKIIPPASKPKSNQQDLRKMFAKRSAASSSGSGTSGRTSLGRNFCLSEDEFGELKKLWSIEDVTKFDKIPGRVEFWSKSAEDILVNEDLASSSVDLGTYIEFMRYSQRTHIVSNSSDSELLSNLLMWADERRDTEENVGCGGLSSQVTSTQLWPTKSSKRKPPAANFKKPGRPRKNGTINFHFPPQRKDIEECQEPAQPPKQKRKFIDDDDEDDMPDVLDPVLDQQQPHMSTSSTSSSMAPPTSSPAPKPVPQICEADVSSAVKAEVVTIDSDDEDDLNTSSSSGFAYMSSQASMQDKYRDLSRALKKQSYSGEDECNICDFLFPCNSLNGLVMGKRLIKSSLSWKEVSKSLDEAFALAPLITKEVLSNYHNGESRSQRMVSPWPDHEIVEENEMFDGLLCGGVGDLVPPRDAIDSKMPAAVLNSSFISPSKVKKVESFEMEVDGTLNVSDEPAECMVSSPKTETNVMDARIEFEDVSFDFLGLSRIEDVFNSSKTEEEERRPDRSQEVLGTKVSKSVSPVRSTMHDQKHEEISDHSTGCNPKKFGVGNSTPVKQPSVIMKPGEQVSTECWTPPKANPITTDQVSPILCSQVVKKPSLRLRKKSTQTETFQSKINSMPKVCTNDNEEFMEGRSNHQEVTSSSQLSTSPLQVKPPEVNFDLFDDSLLSPESDTREVVVGEDLKEAIMKKAMEAKVKKPEITFTQELSNMGDFSLGGLTQVLEMYDAKEKSPDLRLQQADSLSPPQKIERSSISFSDNELNAAKIEDYDDNDVATQKCSEEDLFADCDDSIFCRMDSTGQLPAPANENENNSLEADQTKKLDGCNTPQAGGTGPEEQNVVLCSDRSTSPVFKPSQKVNRLRLKRKGECKLVPMTESNSEKGKLDGESLKNQTIRDSALSKNIAKETESSEVDFSMFGDEFNNEWLRSQDNIADDCKRTAPSNQSDLGIVAEMPKKSPGEDCKVESPISKVVKDSSPDDDLEAAFAVLDAARKEKKKSVEITSSSTPKILKTTSVHPEQTTNKPARNFTFRKKLSLKDKPSSSTVCIKKDGWISVQPLAETSVNLKQTLSKSREVNLSDFCDDSLLEVLDDNEHHAETSCGQICEDSDRKRKAEEKMGSRKLEKPQNVDETRLKKKLSLGRKGKSSNYLEQSSKDSASATTKKTPNGDIVVLSSSDEEVNIKLPTKRKKCLNITSSPEDVSRPDNNKSALLDLSTFCDDSLLNDIVDTDCDGERKGASAKRNRILSSSDEDVFVPKDNRKTKVKKNKLRKKKRGSRKGNGFIMSEAEESEDEQRLSSDGESTSLDELDSSFINDSQPEASQSVVDIHHKYLESVRSPVTAVGRFKIPSRLPEVDVNVFSQFPDASEMNQSYANDSFCVDDEPTQYDHEVSLLEMAERKLKAKRKAKRKRRELSVSGNDSSNDSGGNQSEEEVVGKKRRLKRIKMLEETILEDEENNLEECRQDPNLKEPDVGKSCLGVTNNPHAASNQSYDEAIDDLAKLLDEDDLDFSFIPDNPEVAASSTNVKAESPKPSTSKFVKKAPFLQNANSIKSNSFRPESNGLSSIQQIHQPVHLPANMSATTSKNIWPSVESRAGPCAKEASHSKGSATCSSSPTFIIASSKQIAQSPDVLRILRVDYRTIIIPHSVPDADFIIGWRLGLSRVFASDLRDRKKLEDVVTKLKRSYCKPHLIIESDRLKLLSSKGAQKKGKTSKLSAPALVDQSSTSLSPWSSLGTCVNAALLRQAGVHLLFSQNNDETAGYLAKLARRETNAGHGVPAFAQNLSEEVEARLSFFTRLPGINYAFALNLLSKFETLADFLERCSGVREIASTLEIGLDTARQIHLLLKESYFMP